MKGKNRTPKVYHVFAHTVYIESMGGLGSIDHGVDNWYVCTVVAYTAKQARNWVWANREKIDGDFLSYAEFTDMRAKVSPREDNIVIWETDKEVPYIYDWPPMTEEEERKIVEELESLEI